MAKTKKSISKKEFVKQFTDLAIKHLSKLPPKEQEARIRAFERTASTTGRGDHPRL